jgi:capsular exopolysaccharide synthesis family protein
MPRANSNKVIMLHAFPHSPLSDAYRNLRINIDFAAAKRDIRTIAVISAHPAEGKTTTALNLAVAYAQVGKKVLLVDADTRKPSMHVSFRTDNGIGLTNLLVQQNKASEAIKATDIQNLSILTAGQVHYNIAELLASRAFDELLDEMKQAFDLILIDTPPALALMDAKIIAAKSDGVLLVVEYRKVKRDEASRLKEDLAEVNANLLGVAFNKINNKDVEMYSYG